MEEKVLLETAVKKCWMWCDAFEAEVCLLGSPLEPVCGLKCKNDRRCKRLVKIAEENAILGE